MFVSARERDIWYLKEFDIVLLKILNDCSAEKKHFGRH